MTRRELLCAACAPALAPLAGLVPVSPVPGQSLNLQLVRASPTTVVSIDPAQGFAPICQADFAAACDAAIYEGILRKGSLNLLGKGEYREITFQTDTKRG